MTEKDHFKSLIYVTSHHKDAQGNTYTESGPGFIVNKKYVATCYHVYQPPFAKDKPFRVVVNYNFRLGINEKLLFDEVDVDLNYKYTDGQYDFSNHTYIDKDFKTDFIVLKLNEELDIPNPSFNFGSVEKYSPMVVTSFHPTYKVVLPTELVYFYKEYNPKFPETYFHVFVGIPQHGYSGAPIYNPSGEIVGVFQSGDPTIQIDKLKFWVEQGALSDKDFEIISGTYKRGLSISYGFNIKYLFDCYLTGFIK